ncbi:MAG: hypothetical protein U0W40_09690 [Acidimicrobiia bacterium]
MSVFVVGHSRTVRECPARLASGRSCFSFRGHGVVVENGSLLWFLAFFAALYVLLFVVVQAHAARSPGKTLLGVQVIDHQARSRASGARRSGRWPGSSARSRSSCRSRCGVPGSPPATGASATSSPARTWSVAAPGHPGRAEKPLGVVKLPRKVVEIRDGYRDRGAEQNDEDRGAPTWSAW